MEHVPVLALILALVLGLVSLALLARLPRHEATPGVRWLPITLLLYNLWVAGFLTANYLSDRVLPHATPRVAPPLVDAWAIVLLALAVAWLFAHVVQLQSFLGNEPTDRARRAALYTVGGVVAGLSGMWVISAWTGSSGVFRLSVSLAGGLVFPAALVASAMFVFRSRRLDNPTWRTRFSSLGLAYVGIFACLFVLSILWSRLATQSAVLPLALDAVLELLYNIVAIVWVLRSTMWRPAVAPQVSSTAIDRARLLADYGVTRREAEIIELICLGKTNQEIADQLFISLTTVKDHNYVTFQKLGVRNRTELARLVLGAQPAPPK